MNRYGNTYRRVIRSWWMYQRTKFGHEYLRDCPWCESPNSFKWFAYEKAPFKFSNGRSYGQWRCLWYGQCEAA